MNAPHLHARVLDPRDLDPAQVAFWDGLLARHAPLQSPFLSVHYARAVQASGKCVRVCVIFRDDAVAGFFPFQFDSLGARLVGAASPLGGVMTDYVGLVAAPELRVAPAQLLKLARLNTFTFSHLDQTQQAFGLDGEQPRIGLRLRLDADDPLGALLRPQHRYMKDSERCARLAERDLGVLEFSFDQHENRSAMLDQLIEQKRLQYQRTQVPDSLHEPWTRQLLHQLAQTDQPGCHGQLSTLYAGGKWLASHFGLVCHGVLHHWMPVYNADFNKYAPGRLLMHRMIEACPPAGILTIDHGEGDSTSKRQTANEEHFYYRGQWHNRSMASFVSRGYQSLRWRLEA
jgi:CelD/BcsL family acetyltransferase involved in cellulose biosynthesis